MAAENWLPSSHRYMFGSSRGKLIAQLGVQQAKKECHSLKIATPTTSTPKTTANEGIQEKRVVLAEVNENEEIVQHNNLPDIDKQLCVLTTTTTTIAPPTTTTNEEYGLVAAAPVENGNKELQLHYLTNIDKENGLTTAIENGDHISPTTSNYLPKSNISIEVDDLELKQLLESNCFVLNDYVVVNEKVTEQTEDFVAVSDIGGNMILDDDQENDSARLNENGEVIEFQELIATETQAQDVEEVSDNSNLFTKKGTIRKRKKHDLSRAERKKVKIVEKASARSVQGNCASNNCKIKCPSYISEEGQKEINTQYWALESVQERKAFVLSSFSQMAVKRKTTGPDSRRKWTNEYYLKTDGGTLVKVCKAFFLDTLGYSKNNDKILQNVSKQKNNIAPTPDKRKGRVPKNKANHEIIIEDINSYEPTISHHRREHAPNKRYLPSDLTIMKMHESFLEKHPNMTCSYDLYRSEVAKQNISFVKLGHEECEACEHFNLHGHSKNDLHLDDCETCVLWNTHITKANTAREEYQKDANKGSNDESIIYSVDMEKVIMLPRCEMFKNVIFTKRLTVYNESFVPVGKKNSWPSVACLWHDAIRGRNKEEIISIVFKFLTTHCRNVKHITLWMDNCSAQNKNWAYLTFLVFIINSTQICAESIEIKYFEPGHTFMSCDSFHHLVEKSLHKAKKVYDFEDFKKVVQSCSTSSNVSAIEMNPTDFFMWKDLSLKRTPKKKLAQKGKKQRKSRCASAESLEVEGILKESGKNNSTTGEQDQGEPQMEEETVERPLLKDIMLVKAERGFHHLLYKRSYEEKEEWKPLNFLAPAVVKNGIKLPPSHTNPMGVSSARKKEIITTLLLSQKGIVPPNRFAFWEQLPVAD